MMRIEELELLIQKACWFEHLGEPLTNRGFVQVSSLGPWAKFQTGDDELEEIANQMEWLPSSREQTDPIHGSSMEERSAQGAKSEEYSRRSLDIYKKTAASLRHFEGQPALKIGPFDFTEAARGAALYASRRAAYEILLSNCGPWCAIMDLYQQGHWPFGILTNRNIVFF